MEPIIGGANAGAGGQAAAGDLIKDSDTQNFSRDVIDASMQVPVIVDFWAPWCGPCKQLTPLIEKVVGEARGAVKLVKINVDENQQLAQQLRIQSLPTVYAFFQGRPLDGFQGALPESQIKTFVQQLVDQAGGQGQGEEQDPVAEALAQAKELLDAGQHDQALQLYAQVANHDPENGEAVGGLIRCQVAAGQLKEAKALLEQISDEVKAKPEVTSAITALELAEEQQAAAGKLGELMERVAANHDDLEARFELALALSASGKRQAAADELLEILKRNRGWNDDAARLQLLKFFEAWGPTDPVTVEARRRLSSLLFS
ncbi:MAG: thioredoxin [Rhodovibrionaceae bacterium]|nr:thioredoxin [Rhodovibrionaceae bacterium]